MSSKHHPTNLHDWNASNVLDDVDFQEHEARQVLHRRGSIAAGQDGAAADRNGVDRRSLGLIQERKD